MKVLVIGNGGREHALRWKLRQSHYVRMVKAPGDLSVRDYVMLAEAEGIELTVVGPEAPLVAGVVDEFRWRNMPIVGPTAPNAALEGSKVYSKRFMQEHGIPTARFETVGTEQAALDALRNFRLPVVLKTDGLAAGKGVIIAQTRAEAESAIETLAFPLVIEEFLEGEEISFIALCDGTRAAPLEPSQDHKRVFDNDEGPNTGGMGAYSDSLLLTAEQVGVIMETIIMPVVRATKFTGFLYAGLMMTADGPSVLEFNVRMGDPETQALMMRLKSDWAEVLMEVAQGELKGGLLWTRDAATCVVIASGGYPGPYETGKKITGIHDFVDGMVFHAGTRREGENWVTAGGRVLGVTATGPTLRESIDNAYAGVSLLHFEGMHYRKDIGQKGLKRYNETGPGT